MAHQATITVKKFFDNDDNIFKTYHPISILFSDYFADEEYSRARGKDIREIEKLIKEAPKGSEIEISFRVKQKSPE